MKNLKKKGFTIVELVIVIAVIAVLAAVLIPTFVNLTRKANISADTVLVKNLNTSLSSDAKEHKTMHDALEAAKANGYDIAKIQTKANGNKILWDSKNDCFVYLDSDKDKIVYIPDTKSVDVENKDLWVISNEVSDTYSTYLYGYEETSVTAKYGLDVGECAITSVTYTEQTAGTVAVRTTAGTLTLNAPNATVNHYGGADEVYVNDVATATYNIFGVVSFIQVAEGEHVVLKAGSSVSGLFVSGDKSCVEVENGQENVVKSDADGVTADSVKDSATKFGGGNGTEQNPYIIRNVEHMKNIGTIETESFYKVADGVKVIDLSGYKEVVLKGSFDGNNVVFTNLQSRLFNGVYAPATNKSEIKNFEVDHTAKISGAYGAALINNVYNDLVLSSITMHGYIEASNAFGASFVGMGRNGANITINSCTSDVKIVNTSAEPSAGFVGFLMNSGNLEINNSSFKGSIFTNESTSTAKAYKYYSQAVGSIKVDGNNVTNNLLVENENWFKFSSISVTKEQDGYYVEKKTTGGVATEYEITIEVRAKLKSDQQIYNFEIYKNTIDVTDKSGSIKVFDLINEMYINKDGITETAFENGIYQIYNSKYEAGYLTNIKIYIVQKDGNQNIIASSVYNSISGGDIQ